MDIQCPVTTETRPLIRNKIRLQRTINCDKDQRVNCNSISGYVGTCKGDKQVSISPKFEGPLMSLIIAIGMGCVMSFVMVAINVGFTDSFLPIWFRSWFVGFLVGFPTAALLVPLARKIVLRITGQKIEK